jgi:hypothetical protein
MLMVIFGAGASFDSVPSIPIRPEDQYRPPLADRLFDTRPIFKETMARFEKCQPVIPYLQDRYAAVERVLEWLQEEAKNYAEGYRQLAAIRYYLHYWLEIAQGVTNYKTLLDQIERWRKPGQEVCLATFNYDTMLEAALPTVGVKIQRMDDYIANKHYKVIKLHGSINWAREINIDIRSKNPGTICDDVINQAADLVSPNSMSLNYSIVTGYLIGKADDKVLFPALAIPVETKSSFECPEQHLNMVRQCIKKVSKLLLIGWRGMEDHFLHLLSEHLPSGISIMAVNGRADDAKQTLMRLEKAGIKFEAVPSDPMKVGFSEFVVQRIGEAFLKS